MLENSTSGVAALRRHPMIPRRQIKLEMHQVKRLMKSALQKYVPQAVKRASLAFDLQDMRRDLTERFISTYGNFVQSGPFQGMELPTQFCWSDGDRLPKLIGSYEA